MAETRIKGAVDDKKLFHEIMSDIKRYCDEEQRMLMQKELAKETVRRKKAEDRQKKEINLRKQAEAKQKQSESELKKFQDIVESMRNGFSYEEALAMCKQ